MDPMQTKIWELHDKLSDAILHTVRSRHVSPSPLFPLPRHNKNPNNNSNYNNNNNNKEYYYYYYYDEAKRLSGIRAALETLEDHLHFFRTVQVQQRAERDTAIARLEQSRIFLAKKLSEHHGKKYKVIEEALQFVDDATQFVSANFPSAPCPPGEKYVTRKGIRINLIKIIVSIFGFAKKSAKVKEIGGILGNAALVALSMLALLHFHQTGSKDKYMLGFPEENVLYNKNIRKSHRLEDTPSTNPFVHLDVTLARG